jgi:hypothetical protein
LTKTRFEPAYYIYDDLYNEYQNTFMMTLWVEKSPEVYKCLERVVIINKVVFFCKASTWDIQWYCTVVHVWTALLGIV